MGQTDTMGILQEARRRAENLLADLLRHQRQMESGTHPIDPAQAQAGLRAMTHAVDAARQMLQSIQRAIEQEGECANRAQV